MVGWMKQSVCACTQLDGDDEAMHRRELKLNVIFAVQRILLPRPSQCGSIMLTVYLAPLLIYRQQFLSVQICHLFGVRAAEIICYDQSPCCPVYCPHLFTRENSKKSQVEGN